MRTLVILSLLLGVLGLSAPSVVTTAPTPTLMADGGDYDTGGG